MFFIIDKKVNVTQDIDGNNLNNMY